ncbi:MAG: undecaprenyl-diphosphate phosphatase [bacterium]|nr:undecaprenyl-diphosphate phosphatase [bacterium]
MENIILGIIQGITEWLPVSSKSAIILIEENIFNRPNSISEIIRLALFLHLGTFLAALIYLRKDVRHILGSIFNYKSSDAETKKITKFLIISTLVSGIIGLGLFKILLNLESISPVTGKIATLVIGLLLLVTAVIQLRAKKGGIRQASELTNKDSVILGIAQGLAAIPGFSRSGFTVSALLLRKFNDDTALRLSFLMSLPAVLGGNIVLNLTNLSLSTGNLISLLFSFVFGLLTIDLLLRFAKKVNFGYFVLFFGIITIATSLLI